MNVRTVKSDVLLFITALIWGFAFVAQRVGMDYVGPFTFNGARFALGALFLLPLIAFRSRSAAGLTARTTRKEIILGGLLAGFVLFTGASLQQVGLLYTTAGNAGFITGLYVVIVPVLGIFLGQQTDTGTWVGAVLAVAGLYLLCATGGMTVSAGDLLVLAGAFFWAGHVLVIGWLSPKMDSFRLAFYQYAACAALSIVVGSLWEIITLDALLRGAAPILYGGIMSVGIAYTLQVVGQKHAPSSHAAILLSLEAVFAAVGGWLLLGERLTSRQYLGCTLMLLGMLVSQLWRVCFTGRAADGCDDSGEKGFTVLDRG
jgi:drug/metabolite transporter (DMT)-like permease